MGFLLLFFLAVEGTELDAISKFSEIVPDTVIFDDFERWAIDAWLLSMTCDQLNYIGCNAIPLSSLALSSQGHWGLESAG